MKVLHLIGGELTGGAARGAYWLHQGLLELGVDSKIITNSLETLNDITVNTILNSKRQKINKRVRSQLDDSPFYIYKKEKTSFNTAFFGYDFSKHPLYEWADIINLHWINSGFVKIRDLSKVNKPIVWTMRDMWPMTGGCHYSLDCRNYETGCGHCGQLNSNKKYDLSRLIIKNKKKHIPDHMVLIGISNWLSDCAKSSYLFNKFRVETFYNNINCKEFFPVEKEIARKILGLPQGKKIVLAGATGLTNYYKGFEKYLGAVKKLDGDDNKNILLLYFGRLDESLVSELGFEYKSLGYLNDTISLRLAYSAADVFVAPSIMDAFGKTLAESMACGTPVVAFNATGPKDIVDHKENGYLAEAYDTADLAKGIKWIIGHENPDKLQKNAQLKIKKNYDIIKVANSYKSLYEELLSN